MRRHFLILDALYGVGSQSNQSRQASLSIKQCGLGDRFARKWNPAVLA